MTRDDNFEPVDPGTDRDDLQEDPSMSLDVAPIVGSDASLSPRRPARPAPAAPVHAAQEDSVSIDTIPASPPQEVLDAIQVAAHVAEELHAQGRELRFDVDSNSHRVRVEVRDLDGNVLRRVPASSALEIAGGAPIEPHAGTSS
jgi:uncharacterized FlaG/YvyC family protein